MINLPIELWVNKKITFNVCAVYVAEQILELFLVLPSIMKIFRLALCRVVANLLSKSSLRAIFATELFNRRAWILVAMKFCVMQNHTR